MEEGVGVAGDDGELAGEVLWVGEGDELAVDVVAEPEVEGEDPAGGEEGECGLADALP